ncbi:unnamed protein product [Paramecium primaurelia]|uniref:Uncharacterized protein n=1 Tax=Paramecium primaurelia TaxID=5886 RepID=A0A8S1KKT8_PARPR|nr:unnamed protein product [Paramecium primaurelia]
MDHNNQNINHDNQHKCQMLLNKSMNNINKHHLINKNWLHIQCIYIDL